MSIISHPTTVSHHLWRKKEKKKRKTLLSPYSSFFSNAALMQCLGIVPKHILFPKHSFLEEEIFLKNLNSGFKFFEVGEIVACGILNFFAVWEAKVCVCYFHPFSVKVSLSLPTNFVFPNKKITEHILKIENPGQALIFAYRNYQKYNTFTFKRSIFPNCPFSLERRGS